MPRVVNNTLLDLTLCVLHAAYGEQADVHLYGMDVDRLPAIRVKPQRRQAWQVKSGELLLMAVNVMTYTEWGEEWRIDLPDLTHTSDGHVHPGYLPATLAHLPMQIRESEPVRLYRGHDSRQFRVLHKWRTRLEYEPRARKPQS